jgi:[acyl-carrier-protein] S-malonyltransferase
MPAEYHPGTDIEIPDAVPTSGFRNAIRNTKRYMKHNRQTVEKVAEASYTGDYDLLEELLKTGDEQNLFNGDLNLHVPTKTCLHLAAQAGQTDCVELLLEAKADPHMKERLPYGNDPEDGKTARGLADEYGFDDIVELLLVAEQDFSYGWYVPEGPTNNEKMYDCWEFGEGNKTEKGWYSSRPGVAQRNGFDPLKYGGPTPSPPQIFEGYVDASTDAIRAEMPAAQQRLPIAFIFPAESSHYVKMLAADKDYPEIKYMLDYANDLLETDLRMICLQGPEGTLEEPVNCHCAVFIASLAARLQMFRHQPDAVNRARAVSGMSLGVYTALCAAGVFTFEEGLRLVKIRAEAIDEVAKLSNQLQVSVAGLDKATIMSICIESENVGPGEVCGIAHELFGKGFLCSGTYDAMIRLEQLAAKKGALQVKILKGIGAVHSPLMQPAQTRLNRALEEALPRMSPPNYTVYISTAVAPVLPGTHPEEIVAKLKTELISPVLWEAAVRLMANDGIQRFYECGPMKQMKAMMKRIDKRVWENTLNIDV